jgi:activator of HSP90 ATPase
VLEAPKRIIQQWRTSEFAEGEKDSLLEILFEEGAEGTRITIRHSELPEHGMQYKQGWVDSYFNPMKEYFSSK